MKKNLLINFLKKITIIKISLFFTFYFGIGSYLDFSTSDIFKERADAKQEAYALEVKRKQNELQAKAEAEGLYGFVDPFINNRHPDYQIAWQYEESGKQKGGIFNNLILHCNNPRNYKMDSGKG